MYLAMKMKADHCKFQVWCFITGYQTSYQGELLRNKPDQHLNSISGVWLCNFTDIPSITVDNFRRTDTKVISKIHFFSQDHLTFDFGLLIGLSLAMRYLSYLALLYRSRRPVTKWNSFFIEVQNVEIEIVGIKIVEIKNCQHQNNCWNQNCWNQNCWNQNGWNQNCWNQNANITNFPNLTT
jgi:hypothetical protein